MTTIIGVTGHRPLATGGYSDKVIEELDNFAYSVLLGLKTVTPDVRIISGVAQGWDQSIVIAAARLDIGVCAAKPFADQDAIWPLAARKRYEQVLQLCDRIECICDGPAENWKYQRRNEWLVDASDEILTLWNGRSGGTANCLAYARRKKKKITNVWMLWTETRQPR